MMHKRLSLVYLGIGIIVSVISIQTDIGLTNILRKSVVNNTMYVPSYGLLRIIWLIPFPLYAWNKNRIHNFAKRFATLSSSINIIFSILVFTMIWSILVLIFYLNLVLIRLPTHVINSILPTICLQSIVCPSCCLFIWHYVCSIGSSNNN